MRCLPEPREGTRSRPPASATRNMEHETRWSEGRICRHLGRVAASPEPATTRARRPEAPDGVAPVGASSPTGKPEAWVGWDSVDRPAVGTRNTHPLTARSPDVTRALSRFGCGVATCYQFRYGSDLWFSSGEGDHSTGGLGNRPRPLVCSSGERAA